MKKLLIHIGYPKAASTTLQNSLFMGLHELQLINFLGRAFESDYFGFADSKREFKEWLKFLGSNDYYLRSYETNSNKKIPNIFPEISNNVLNVLSEGAFILNDRKDKAFLMPEKIRKFFEGKVDRIDILVVIRSQITLIMSNYVQRYRKIEEKTFSEYLDVHMNGKKQGLGDFKIYNFYNLAMKYAEVFGNDNVHLLFFEDMVNDKPAFISEISSNINVENHYINKCLGDSKLNATKLDSDYHICKKPVSNSFRYQLGRILKKMRLSSGEMMKTKVPKITRDEEETIFDYFKESNLMLAEEFSFNTEKMKKYRYF